MFSIHVLGYQFIILLLLTLNAHHHTHLLSNIIPRLFPPSFHFPIFSIVKVPLIFLPSRLKWVHHLSLSLCPSHSSYSFSFPSAFSFILSLFITPFLCLYACLSLFVCLLVTVCRSFCLIVCM